MAHGDGLPKASVVICTMDRPESLDRCLASLAAQSAPPAEVIVVHAGADTGLEGDLRRRYADAPFTLMYLRAQPSLVRQRNLGFSRSSGDVVFFLDDDVVLSPDYCEKVLSEYRADDRRRIGGVQGSLSNPPRAVAGSGWLRRVFRLTRMGRRGYLQRSGFPCVSVAVAQATDVEVFSGCMMSFRRTLLERHRFDEALSRYWWGDDWDLSYRVSREARLVQLPDARLAHDQAEPGRDGERRGWRMMVVNHRYLYEKHFRSAGGGWLPCWWGELGFLILASLRALTGRGAGALRGMAEGYWELARLRAAGDQAPPPTHDLGVKRDSP